MSWMQIGQLLDPAQQIVGQVLNFMRLGWLELEAANNQASDPAVVSRRSIVKVDIVSLSPKIKGRGLEFLPSKPYI